MRRYLMAGVVAEVVSVMCLWIFVGFLRLGAHQQLLTDMCFQILPEGHGGWVVAQLVSENLRFNGCSLEDRAFKLGSQLDFMDNALPFLSGFPAIAVLSLWTFDRRRKEKKPT
jgi:hypothetical protein